MSYTVLARKYRSATFDEVVGQETVTATLRNAIAQARVHHGYLFCGTRGVGKTSMARILAKALNCLSSDGPTVTPCGTCDACVAIGRGDDVDVVEIDAASNTGVDNIRELRSNTVYRPTRCRFKVYIIDEVHMLSPGAFNALLKTLEEPPSHVKFIFATTEVQKVPATILSRVQRFDFKSIPAPEITAQLLKICKAESVEIEEAAAKRLARLASGSMRDALSLLDQVLSMAGPRIGSEIVDELFPAAHDELFAELIDKLAESDAAGALDLADRTLGQGYSPDYWCTLLIAQLRDLMILRACGSDTDLVDVPAALRPRLVEQSRRFDEGAYVYMISVLEELRRAVKTSGSGRALVEAGIVRLAEASKFSSIESLLALVQGDGAGAVSHPAPAPAARSGAPAKKNAPPAERSFVEGGTDRLSLTSSMSRMPNPREPRTADETAAEVGAKPAAQAVAKPVRRSAPVDKPLLGAGAARRTTQDDIRAAEAEPVVRQALELFGGQIVEVRRTETRAAEAGPVDKKS